MQPELLMLRRILLLLLFAGAFVASALVASSETAVAAQPGTSFSITDSALLALTRGPGGYLSAVKIGLVAITFFFWVWLANWIHKDSVRIAELTQMKPEIWNPINLLSCLIGFFIAISLPTFWIGYPVFVCCAILPWLTYRLMRRSKMKANAEVRQAATGKGSDGPVMEALEQDQGIDVKFTPAGADETEQQSNLIMARQSDGYPKLKELIYESMFKRADVVVMDYTQTSVSPRLLVDGSWHKMDPMDRIEGDAVLVSLKHLAGMNPAERKQQQIGRFSAKMDLGKIDVNTVSRGVKTGEQVQLKFLRKSGAILPLKKLGMFPSMEKRFVPELNKPGITIVSAPAGQGLTTTWQGVLVSSDRLTRDNVGIIATDENETDVENIVVRRYDREKETGDESQLEVLNRALLSQPDSLAVPQLGSGAVLDVLSAQAIKQDRAVWLRANAKSSAQALMKVFAICGNRDDLAQALKQVTCQRLVRRLCNDCKQEIQVKPELIKKLGGDPSKQQTLCRPWKLPPPEQRVDEKGNEIEFPPCNTCGGIGYIGRIAAFEMILVNQAIRDTLKKAPTVENVESAAVKSKSKIPLSQSAYKLVLLGITSLAEIQKVLKK
jgi:type II secretory ATPase GspE/PulE/Tfp pilus assembly ATPase PilB-like protein